MNKNLKTALESVNKRIKQTTIFEDDDISPPQLWKLIRDWLSLHEWESYSDREECEDRIGTLVDNVMIYMNKY